MSRPRSSPRDRRGDARARIVNRRDADTHRSALGCTVNVRVSRRGRHECPPRVRDPAWLGRRPPARSPCCTRGDHAVYLDVGAGASASSARAPSRCRARCAPSSARRPSPAAHRRVGDGVITPGPRRARTIVDATSRSCRRRPRQVGRGPARAPLDAVRAHLPATRSRARPLDADAVARLLGARRRADAARRRRARAAGWPRTAAGRAPRPSATQAAVALRSERTTAAVGDPARLRAARRGGAAVRGACSVGPRHADGAGPVPWSTRPSDLLAVGHSSGAGLARRRPLSRAPRWAILRHGGRMTDVVVHVELRPGAYADSVTLLQVSRTVQRIDGVAAAQVAMATPLNLEVLTEMGFDVRRMPPQRHGRRRPAGRPARASTRALAGVDAALREVDPALAAPGATQAPPRTTAHRLARASTAGLALVSVPGASRGGRGDGRPRRRLRRDGLQRQRAGRAGGRAQAASRRRAGCW